MPVIKSDGELKWIKRFEENTKNMKKCLYIETEACYEAPTDSICLACKTRMKYLTPDEKEYATNRPGLKYDGDKPKWELLPLSLINETVKVLTMGAKKYGPNNWQKVENADERYYAALMRHIVAYREGESIDPESGLSHLAHAMCNLIFLSELQRVVQE
jgi:hypothetical protein